ncbi:MAG TPA: DUF4870 domain-containing protein [Ktedonobacteraceae bacterium]|nr:DUF4870 domain-containing protein [Ktedonobacteraceae bacterium]
MSWNPNQPNSGQDPNQQGQYGGYNPPPQGQYGGYNPPPGGGQYNAYNQPGGAYQQPYSTPPAGTVSPLGPSSIGMDPKIAAGLSYLIGIVGLIFFFIEKKNRFVKFNALQAISLHVSFGIVEFVVFIVYFALLVATSGSGIVGLFGCLLGLVGIGWFVGWLLAMIQAFQGKYFKFPIIGAWADGIVSKTPGLV